MRRRPSPLGPGNDQLYQALGNAAEFLRSYHAYRAFGIERIPEEGPALLVFNHSFASYDMFLLAAEIYERTGRVMRPLGDRLIFKLPIVNKFASTIGVVEGCMANAVPLLDQGALVAVAPGGMYEALRPSTQKYELEWETRRGFAKLAIQAQSPIILAACPAADDLYTLYDNKLTRKLYTKFRVPIPLLRGMGPSLLPRPVQLTHELSIPLIPPEPADDPAQAQEDLRTFHRLIVKEMEELMQLAASHHHVPYSDNWETRPT